MSYIVFVIIGLFSVVGWRRATERIENPPGKYDFPGGMSRRDHLRILPASTASGGFRSPSAMA